MGGVLGDFSNWLFGSPQNPANAASPYLNQIPGMIGGAYNPYMQGGQFALPTLESQYSAMAQNPGSFINQMGQGFQQSPGYQFQTQQALNAANRAAAAGGMVGSPQEQQNIAGVVNGLANQDYYNWMNHAMGAQQTGLGGLGGLYQGGLSAARGYAGDMGSALESQANLAYSGAANQNQMQQGQEGALLGFGGDILGSLFGGGMGGGQGGGSSYGMPSLGWLGSLASFL